MPTEGLGSNFFYIVAAVFGLLIGSFLNVCILSWGKEPPESVLRPRSRCPKCGNQIAWYDNIPVISWLILLGKCRHCRERISLMYPLVELAHRPHLGLLRLALRSHPRRRPCRASSSPCCSASWSPMPAPYIIPDEFTIGGARARPDHHRHRRRPARPHLLPHGRRTRLRRPLGRRLARLHHPQAGCDGRWRHQDDGDGRRLRRLDRCAAHDFPRRAHRHHHLPPARTHGTEEARCPSASTSPSGPVSPTSSARRSCSGTPSPT